jgi:hypothetical protein
MIYILTMEKEALLSIIINNLKEVETLVETFRGKPSISPAFIRLTLQKIESIREEISLLQSFNEELTPAPVTPKAEDSNKAKLPDFEWTTGPEIEIGASAVKIATEESHTQPIAPIPQPELTTQPAPAPEPPIQEKITIIPSPKAHPQPVEEPPATNVEAETPLQSQKTKPRTAQTIGEILVPGKTTLVDKIAVSKELANQVAIGKPVDDIRKAIGINDRFLYQRELFDGNASRMDQAIDELNRLSTYQEARTFIRSNFDWEETNATVESFMNSVQRRFI